MKYKLLDKEFKNQKEFVEFIRGILNKYDAHQELDHIDSRYIKMLVYLHPNAKEKVGNGIDRIFVRRNPTFPDQKQFIIIRIDKSLIDFSYLKCIRGVDHTPLQKFKGAARQAISDQIIFYKDQKVDLHMEMGKVHADHVIPFDKLVTDFIKEEQIDVDKIKIIGKTRYEFKDKELKDKWKKYHDIHALLQMISAHDNLTKKRK